MMNLVNTHNSPKYNSCFVSALYLVEATLKRDASDYHQIN